MSLARCRAALEKLKNFQLTQADLRRLMQLAVNFTHELAQAGLGEELSRRATLFEALTAPGSTFDEARRDAHALLSSSDYKLIIPDPFWLPLVPALVGMDEYCVWNIRDRLADHDWPRWHLQAALNDVTRLVELIMTETQREVLKRWQQEVWHLSTQSARDHLFGCYLLAECEKALDPVPSGFEHSRKLQKRLMDNIKEMRDAAEYILLAEAQYVKIPAANQGEVINDATQQHCPQPVPSNTTSSTAIGAVNNAPWCHAQGDERPAEYAHGPLAGTLTQLADVICPVFRREADPRGLKQLGQRGCIWIVKVSGQSYLVYFKDKKLYAEANGNTLALRNEQQRT